MKTISFKLSILIFATLFVFSCYAHKPFPHRKYIKDQSLENARSEQPSNDFIVYRPQPHAYIPLGQEAEGPQRPHPAFPNDHHHNHHGHHGPHKHHRHGPHKHDGHRRHHNHGHEAQNGFNDFSNDHHSFPKFDHQTHRHPEKSWRPHYHHEQTNQANDIFVPNQSPFITPFSPNSTRNESTTGFKHSLSELKELAFKHLLNHIMEENNEKQQSGVASDSSVVRDLITKRLSHKGLNATMAHIFS